MRILWFTPTPAAAVRQITKAKKAGGSWIEALENVITTLPDVKLGVAFPWNTKRVERIKVNGSQTEYFMVPRYPIGKLERRVNNFLCRAEPRKALSGYLEVVEEFQPDIVHFFGTESTFTLIMPQLKVPSAIWFQGNLTVYHTKWESGIRLSQAMRYEKFKDFFKGSTYLQGYHLYKEMARREREIFTKATNFTGRTQWDRRLVNIMAPQANYYHCEEAMRAPFRENEWQPQPQRGKFVLLTTIRTNLYKGLETILQASELLAPLIGKELEWRVVGISPGSTYAKAIYGVTDAPKGKKMVRLLGFKSATELVEELLGANAYVHPSHIENSPNAVCEAMLIGMPVVATNVGGTPDLLDKGEEGLLVQSGDPYAMAGAIMEVYQKPENAARMGANARRRGLQRNDPHRICAELLNIYQKIIGQEASAPVQNGTPPPAWKKA